MSSTPLTADATQPVTTAHHAVADLLICLPTLAPEALPAALHAIVSAFPNEPILVATPTPPEDLTDTPTTLELIPYTSTRSEVGWVLAAGDYASAAHLALERNAHAIILLGGDPTALSAPNALNPALLRTLADTLRSTSTDLVLPRFTLGPNDALVNSALLYPLSRALFAADIHFPLPIDAALSARMAQRLATTTQRLIALNQGSTLLWPVAEAAAANLSIREVSSDATPPTPPAPQTQADFNALFASVAGSLFADIEAKATFWQRARGLTISTSRISSPPPVVGLDASPEIHSLIDTFRIAQDNLQEIWALVLPPQSRLALKKLSQLSPDAFLMEPDLWARIVYDFALAFHLRTLNRNHLLGAMTPLYLAWVASHLRFVADDPTRAAHAIEITASAFESEKSYIVSRWRWPDRFNP